jgi:uncharacterized protein (DUF1499 family)
MPAPPVAIKSGEVGAQARAQGVQVDVADQFEHVRLLLDQDGPKAVLEEMSAAAMAAVEGRGVAAENGLRESGKADIGGAQKEMGVIRHQAPGVDLRARGPDNLADTPEQVRSIAIAPEDPAALDAACHHVVQGSGVVESRTARHASRMICVMRRVKLLVYFSKSFKLLLRPLMVGVVVGAGGCAGVRPDQLGVRQGQLQPCPASPNCVVSDARDEEHGIEPFHLIVAAPRAWIIVQEVLGELPRTVIAKKTADYVHAECRSAVFRYVDDLELHLRPAQGIIAVRSASRLGRSDFGVNRRRVERLRAVLRERDAIR